MPRPQKQTVDYFPHYSNASSGKTLFILESKFGNDGYAFWFKLLEIIASTDGHCFRTGNPSNWQFLVAKTRVTEEKAREILNSLSELGAIDSDLYAQNIIWSENFVSGVAYVYEKRRAQAPKRPSFRPENHVQADVSAPKTPPDLTIPSSEIPRGSKGSKGSKGSIYIGSSEKEVSEKNQKPHPEKSNFHNEVFKAWNDAGIIIHQKITRDMKAAIKSARQDYSVEQLIQAIQNYSEILRGPEYIWSHKWTLAEFLSRRKGNNIERFLDIDAARANFRKEKYGTHKPVSSGSPRALPTSYTRPEDL
jgi:hypothetical protein